MITVGFVLSLLAVAAGAFILGLGVGVNVVKKFYKENPRSELE